MRHTFEDIGLALDVDHGVEGVGPYHLFSIEIEVSSRMQDDTIGWVPCGEGEVFHPGGGFSQVVDEDSITITGLSFSDDEECHMYEYRTGAFIDSPDPMPLSDVQIFSIMFKALGYVENHLDEIDFD